MSWYWVSSAPLSISRVSRELWSRRKGSAPFARASRTSARPIESGTS